MRSLWEAPGGQGRAGDGHHLLPMQDPERGMRPFAVTTKDWAAGRRWKVRNTIQTPGVTYAIVKDGRRLCYRYERADVLHRPRQADEALPSQLWSCWKGRS